MDKIKGTKPDIIFPNGDTVVIMHPMFYHFSIARENYSAQKPYEQAMDYTAFLVEQICLFNGKKRNMEFIKKLDASAYFQIMEKLGEYMPQL